MGLPWESFTVFCAHMKVMFTRNNFFDFVIGYMCSEAFVKLFYIMAANLAQSRKSSPISFSL